MKTKGLELNINKLIKTIVKITKENASLQRALMRERYNASISCSKTEKLKEEIEALKSKIAHTHKLEIDPNFMHDRDVSLNTHPSGYVNTKTGAAHK